MRQIFLPVLMLCGAIQASKQPILNQDHIEQYKSALDKIKFFYIKDLSYEQMVEDSIKSMVRELDPHSDYLTKKELDRLNTDIKGEFAGIGISAIPEDGLIRIIAPLDDSPAKKSGILGGDIIFKVNNKLVANIGVDSALKEIKGKPGTKVKLMIFRPSEKKVKKHTLTRQIIMAYPVKSKILADNILYLRIPTFSEKTTKQVKNSVLKQKYNGIIIDLRNNPGGLLSTGVEVSDIFLDAKRLKSYNQNIVSIKGRIKEFNTVFKAHNGDLAQNKPIVVLINQGSASASEILAGALQNHHRAITVGETTFGKGSVQTVIPGKNSALKITTALYYLPNGETIQAKGIKPDIIIEPLKIIPKKKSMLEIINEASHPNHIANKQDKVDQKLNNEQINQMAEKDFQLYQAAKILETIILERK